MAFKLSYEQSNRGGSNLNSVRVFSLRILIAQSSYILRRLAKYCFCWEVRAGDKHWAEQQGWRGRGMRDLFCGTSFAIGVTAWVVSRCPLQNIHSSVTFTHNVSLRWCIVIISNNPQCSHISWLIKASIYSVVFLFINILIYIFNKAK